MIEGAIIALVSAAVGWIARGARKRANATTPVAVATCGCGHPRSMHEDRAGRCHDRVSKFKTGDALIQCGCQHYDGPEPLSSLYAPEIEG